ncbi:uncharacterized protein LOC117900281 [Drosophila subobscura]|uniref:uncharacterized protein LOC117900281 n=1 Tax=Drosophila subobscura TaxID=7241 RepID=UPI00155A20B7|nr:uncharacterized protein LOC117900281 [Drosophila subobscura]
MEARALRDGQAKAHAMGMEISKECIQLAKQSAAGMEDFVRGMGNAMQDTSTLMEKSPRTMQEQSRDRVQHLENGRIAAETKTATGVLSQQIGQDCVRNAPAETNTNDENAQTKDDTETPEPNKEESSTMIENEEATEERFEETLSEQSLTGMDKAKVKEKEAKEERKLKEKQTKEERQRAQLNVLMEEARRGNESSLKSPKTEIKDSEITAEPKVQAAQDTIRTPNWIAKYLKKPKKAKAAKWKVDSVKMKEDLQQFLSGIESLDTKQRGEDRQEAEEALDIVLNDENMTSWRALLRDLSQTSTFSVATASLSSSQLSSEPRTVVRAILRRSAKMEYKNQLQVLKETYNYRKLLLLKLKQDMKSNYKSEAEELRKAYKQMRPPKL